MFLTVARKYAEALFSVIQDKSTSSLDFWSLVLNDAARVVSNSDVEQFISNPIIGKLEKLEALKNLLSPEAPKMFFNLIELLIERNNLLILPYVSEQFLRLKNNYEGVGVAKIFTAFSLSADQIKSLIAKLESLTGLILRPKILVDESLIGGVKIFIEDKVFDISVKNSLTRMQEVLSAL
ncbi:F-type H+-transporting ATPase subunit delta [Candidatus Kinetoplastibacterium blastocrithidii TCC012E]|uniref:ATP synthase subunit delta n=2 Tax=Candidatus Kinetoplastidibacterium blastocrithidiae TaxID=233181 RepID=M1LAH7_9PROT|nr:F0F1 ATP synthase subunit delta [Candidatus Kinetoplastibacterium blastocrithidii (ex Strigomonas culicis)]AGF49503.1 F-type H+-transporting ATPase subunit delta [Candidatus Kinetoplastibacterium blastocrithidii TCC012E]